MAALNAKKRNKIPAEQFAVPGKRKLPIHDAAHAANAASRLDQTQGLTAGEKATAARKIAAAEKKFGLGKAGKK